MKPEKAKEIFVKEIKCREVALECNGECGSCEYSTGWQQLREAIDMAISALEKQEQSCDTCKHGRFGDRQCDNCGVRYPNHYEAEEEA